MKRRLPAVFSLGSEKDVRGCNAGGEGMSAVSIVLGAWCDGAGVVVLDVFRIDDNDRELGGARESSIELCSSMLSGASGGTGALTCLGLLLDMSSDTDERWDKKVLSSDSAYGLSKAKLG